jgi:hypothetical protein
MRVPSAAQLLDAWDHALSESPTRRALSLLSTAYPELPADEIAALPIGRRDARLLQLRKCLFGSQLLVVVPCPECGQLLESQLRVDDLMFDCVQREEVTYVGESRGYRVTFRLPTSIDLMALPLGGEAADARRLLIRRCLLDVRDAHGEQKAVSDLPDDTVADVIMQMERADPAANLELALECPSCGHGWQEMFDIANLLWREIYAWAQRTLRDVHVLARAYGWRELDVLSLSPTRREIYLELCRQ